MSIDDQIKQSAESLDAHTAEIIKWHFSPETGSPFWLDWAKEQDWNPLEEVSTFSDLCEKLRASVGNDPLPFGATFSPFP